MKHVLKGTVDTLDEAVAVVVLEDGQRLTVPLTKLPDDSGEGSTLYFSLHLDPDMEKERTMLAKSVLNQILNKDA